MPEPTLVCLAESAIQDSEGRICALSLDLTTFQGPAPLVVPAVALIIKIAFTVEECGRDYRLWVDGIDPPGQPGEVEYEQIIHPPVPTPPANGTAFGLVLQILGLTFPEHGLYTICVHLDDKVLRNIRLNVKAPGERKTGGVANDPV